MKLVKFNEPVTFSNLLDEFFTNNLTTMGHERRWSEPLVNISDNEKSYIIDMAVPGKEKEDFDININEKLLTISCEKKEETCKSDNKYSRQEFCYCHFTRSFKMSDDIDTEHISATYERGILKLVLPKKDIDKSKSMKKISIM